MILTSFDVDREIEYRTVFLEFKHTNLETGVVDWDAYGKEYKTIIDAAWKREGEIMKMEFDSMIEDAEAQTDADIRHAELMCSQNTRSSDFPMWALPVFAFTMLTFYLTIRLIG